MAQITRKWLEEQVSLTWTSDVFEWYNNASELINNILNSLEISYVRRDTQDKELVPHAHTVDCKNWRTCTCPPIEKASDLNNYCILCRHLVSIHGKYGCNYNHDQPNYLEVGCTCPHTIGVKV